MALASNALTSVDNLKTYLGITTSTDDTLLETIINNVSDQIERWCDRKFVSQTFKEYITARGTKTLSVANPPIISVDLIAFGMQTALVVESNVTSDLMASVAVDDTQVRLYRVASNGTATTTTKTFADNPTTSGMATAIASVSGFNATSSVDAPTFLLHRMGGRDLKSASVDLTYPDDAESEYRVDYETGFIHLRKDTFPIEKTGDRLSNRFPDQFQSVFVQYTGGYSTIPNALIQAAYELCGDAYQGRSRDRNIKSESIGDYSYTNAEPAGWSQAILELLAPFRRIR